MVDPKPDKKESKERTGFRAEYKIESVIGK